MDPNYKNYMMEDDLASEMKKYKLEIVWKNVILLSLLHSAAFCGIYLSISGQVMIQTILLSIYFFVTNNFLNI